jgi:hypothetical protein
MNRVIKIISATIIILALTLSAIITWKITDSIRIEVRKELQTSFKDSLDEYGKK